MLYRHFGNTGIKLSALGFGTNRFIIKDLSDEKGILNAADLVCKAMSNGVNYIDIAHLYSNNMAEHVLKIALNNIKTDYHITTKIAFSKDKTEDSALRRINRSLETMGIKKASFCFIWSIQSYEEYKEIMKKGSLYEGVLKAKKIGLVDHICFSSHAPAEDIIKIINDDVFEGVLISYNVLNHKIMENVLFAASEKNMGVLTMNSLGGGIIPKNEKYFDCIKTNEYETVSQAALKFIYSHNEITTVLSGMSNTKELMENLDVFKDIDDFSEKYIKQVELKMEQKDGFCTGCNYCFGCPAEIPIDKLMQGYNSTFFDDTNSIYNRNDVELIKNINMFKTIRFNFDIVPKSSKNPCMECGRCENKCTQKLPIIKRISEIYKRTEETCFSLEDWRSRLYDLIKSKNYVKVGFYPSGRYTREIIKLYRKFFKKLDFESYIFDSDSLLWGTLNSNCIKIYPPNEIESIKPDCIIISNYIYSEEIYNSIKHYENLGIEIVKLHNGMDVPWFY